MRNAQKFLWRWNARVVRTEWRQYIVIFSLITVAVSLSIAGVLTAFNAVEPPENRFGRGEVIASTTGDPTAIEQALQSHTYGLVQSGKITAAGSTTSLTVQVMDPNNTVTEPLIRLQQGQWPEADGQIAVTDLVAVDSATVGSTVEINDQMYDVVGIVENPTKLSDEFIFASNLDQFDIPTKKQTSQFIVDAKPEDVTLPAGTAINLSSRDMLLDIRTAAALAVNAVSALAMVEITLLVGAGFAVIARRRSRQYGLLGAVGATPRQIRSAATLSGTIVGVAGGVVGAVIGVAAASIAVPRFESAVGHRITMTVPWWTVAPTVVLAIAAASIAARWPARPLSKLPITHMLASLRPQPAPVGRASIVGVVITCLGGAAIIVGFTTLHTLLAVVGIVLAPTGLLLLSPLLVTAIGVWSRRLPIAFRMGGRAVARHNRRSAAVVAAVAIALGIPVGLAVVTASVDQYNEAKPPNLSEDMAVFWLPGAQDGVQHIPVDFVGKDTSEIVERIQRATPNATVAPIEVAVAADAQPEQETFDSIGSQSAVIPLFAAGALQENCFDCDSFFYGDENGEVGYTPMDAWVANPAMLQALKVTPLDASTNAVGSAEVLAIGDQGSIHDDLSKSITVDETLPRYSSIAPLLLSPEATTTNFNHVTVGWLLIQDSPFSAEAKAGIVSAVGSDVAAEFHKPPQPKSSMRLISVVVGLVIGLSITVAAASLFTAESAEDVRILRSVGASLSTARMLSASMAATLATAGAVIAVFIGYLALLPLLTIKAGDFPFVVPWVSLVGFLGIFPLLAAIAGWVTHSKQTTSLAKPS